MKSRTLYITGLVAIIFVLTSCHGGGQLRGGDDSADQLATFIEGSQTEPGTLVPDLKDGQLAQGSEIIKDFCEEKKVDDKTPSYPKCLEGLGLVSEDVDEVGVISPAMFSSPIMGGGQGMDQMEQGFKEKFGVDISSVTSICWFCRFGAATQGSVEILPPPVRDGEEGAVGDEGQALGDRTVEPSPTPNPGPIGLGAGAMDFSKCEKMMFVLYFENPIEVSTNGVSLSGITVMDKDATVGKKNGNLMVGNYDLVNKAMNGTPDVAANQSPFFKEFSGLPGSFKKVSRVDMSSGNLADFPFSNFMKLDPAATTRAEAFDLGPIGQDNQLGLMAMIRVHSNGVMKGEIVMRVDVDESMPTKNIINQTNEMIKRTNEDGSITIETIEQTAPPSPTGRPTTEEQTQATAQGGVQASTSPAVTTQQNAITNTPATTIDTTAMTAPQQATTTNVTTAPAMTTAGPAQTTTTQAPPVNTITNPQAVPQAAMTSPQQAATTTVLQESLTPSTTTSGGGITTEAP